MVKKQNTQGYTLEMQTRIKQMEIELKKFTDAQKLAKKNIKTFDELDF
jgi:hypothetical protein